MQNFLSVPSTPRVQQSNLIRLAFAAALMSACADPFLQARVGNTPVGDMSLTLTHNEGGLQVTGTRTITTRVDGGLSTSAPVDLTTEQICNSVDRITCNRAEDGHITRICFAPIPSDQIMFFDNHGREFGTNYQICQPARRPPSWIFCTPQTRHSGQFICAQE